MTNNFDEFVNLSCDPAAQVRLRAISEKLAECLYGVDMAAYAELKRLHGKMLEAVAAIDWDNPPPEHVACRDAVRNQIIEANKNLPKHLKLAVL